jgi:hypothetical protein
MSCARVYFYPKQVYSQSSMIFVGVISTIASRSCRDDRWSVDGFMPFLGNSDSFDLPSNFSSRHFEAFKSHLRTDETAFLGVLALTAVVQRLHRNASPPTVDCAKDACLLVTPASSSTREIALFLPSLCYSRVVDTRNSQQRQQELPALVIFHEPPSLVEVSLL